MGANIKIETLGDVVRHGFNLAVQCSCGHRGVIDAAKMERWYRCHRWDTRKHMLREHLYCLRCGGRPAALRAGITADLPNAARGRFPVNEEGWARLVRGLRD